MLLHKIDGQVARINAVYLLNADEGVITISDDRSVRVYLKRDNGQFWPSILHFLPFAPVCMCFDESKLRYVLNCYYPIMFPHSLVI